MFAYFNPIQLNVDPLTLLWLNAFALNLQRSVKMLSVEQTDPPYLDVKIEAIMFRVSTHNSSQKKKLKLFGTFFFSLLLEIVLVSFDAFRLQFPFHLLNEKKPLKTYKVFCLKIKNTIVYFWP